MTSPQAVRRRAQPSSYGTGPAVLVRHRAHAPYGTGPAVPYGTAVRPVSPVRARPGSSRPAAGTSSARCTDSRAAGTARGRPRTTEPAVTSASFSAYVHTSCASASADRSSGWLLSRRVPAGSSGREASTRSPTGTAVENPALRSFSGGACCTWSSRARAATSGSRTGPPRAPAGPRAPAARRTPGAHRCRDAVRGPGRDVRRRQLARHPRRRGPGVHGDGASSGSRTPTPARRPPGRRRARRRRRAVEGHPATAGTRRS
ncbi:hypothetical protein SMICM304S_05740 [Streptomyces microflavus]